jgi:hypothetical protein
MEDVPHERCPSNVRRLDTPLVMAALATALSALPAAANPTADGSQAMPTGVTVADKATPMPAVVERWETEILTANPGSRRIRGTSVLLAPGTVMTAPGPVEAGATVTCPPPTAAS